MSGQSLREHSAKERIPFLDQIVLGDSLILMQQLPDECIDVVITSPPYYQQRDYGGIGLGNEASLSEYIEKLLGIFEQCVRCVKRTGSIFFNIGDKYRIWHDSRCR